MARSASNTPAAPAAEKVTRPRIALPTIVVEEDEDAIPDGVGPGRRPTPEFLAIVEHVKVALDHPNSTYSVKGITTEAQATKVVNYIRKAAKDQNPDTKMKVFYNASLQKVMFQSVGGVK